MGQVSLFSLYNEYQIHVKTYDSNDISTIIFKYIKIHIELHIREYIEHI